MKPGTKIIIEVLSDGTKSYKVSNANGCWTAYGQVGSGSLEDVIKHAIEKVEETNQEEPKKKIVPFDLSLREDKQILRGKTVEYHCLHGSGLDEEDPIYDIEECDIVGFHKNSGHDYWQVIMRYCNSGYKISVTAEELLNDYFFTDTGKPVGKEVEE